ncbi:DUF4302 domain-containing protein [Bacteroides sp. 224]|uniref:DUF4302 domain-containing protein n=1 Tax=Bacteroides sp. 224 TaxID=2302936 RepID=UPI0013D57B83|nr:DUF4302 domain-containing protein [Bacteroides sp. 224]NDV65744.1 DUF4302 domain-containing protein [Bacteroides sp. 224]
MKKYIYLLFISIGLISMQSCSNDEDEIFDVSAAERIAAALKEYQKVLVSAENGWLMEYYAEKEPAKMGGFTYFCKFDTEGKVTMATEVMTSQLPGTKVTSLYKLIADTGPVLTFDTYNELFHIFSEPLGSGDIDGHAGDYEFIIMDVTPQRIEMKGKKYGNRIVLKAVSPEVKWEDYINDVIEMAEDNYYPAYHIKINGAVVASATHSYNTRLFSFTDANNHHFAQQNAIITDKGFTFYNPVDIHGTCIQNFEWNPDQSIYQCTDNATVTLEGFYPDDYLYYNDYMGTYTLTYNDFDGVFHTRKVTLIADIENKTFILKGAGDWDYTMNYDRTTGLTHITSQFLEEWNGYSMYVYSWLGDMYFDSGKSYQYIGYNVSNASKLTLEFRSNKLGTDHIGFFLIAYKDEYYIYDETHFYSNMKMVKQ